MVDRRSDQPVRSDFQNISLSLIRVILFMITKGLVKVSKLAQILTIIKRDLIILLWYDNFIIPLKLVFFGWEDRRRGDLIRGGKIDPTRWASPVRPKLGLGWAIKLLARKKLGQIWPGQPNFIFTLKRLFASTGPVFRSGWAVKILTRKNMDNFDPTRFWPGPARSGPPDCHL